MMHKDEKSPRPSPSAHFYGASTSSVFELGLPQFVYLSAVCGDSVWANIGLLSHVMHHVWSASDVCSISTDIPIRLRHMYPIQYDRIVNLFIRYMIHAGARKRMANLSRR